MHVSFRTFYYFNPNALRENDIFRKGKLLVHCTEGIYRHITHNNLKY
jgi:hypothetical protein